MSTPRRLSSAKLFKLSSYIRVYVGMPYHSGQNYKSSTSLFLNSSAGATFDIDKEPPFSILAKVHRGGGVGDK